MLQMRRLKGFGLKGSKKGLKERASPGAGPLQTARGGASAGAGLPPGCVVTKVELLVGFKTVGLGGAQCLLLVSSAVEPARPFCG